MLDKTFRKNVNTKTTYVYQNHLVNKSISFPPYNKSFGTYWLISSVFRHYLTPKRKPDVNYP